MTLGCLKAFDISEEAGYPWLVGCDGAHSRVRESAQIAFPGQRVGVMAMMDVELTDFRYDDWVNYFIGKDLFMLVTKLPGAYWRLYLSDAGAMTETSTHAPHSRRSPTSSASG